MQENRAVRRAVFEVVLLSVVFLIVVGLFCISVTFLASIEAGQKLQNRPRGLLLGWLTTIAIGLVLGRTRQREAAHLLGFLVVVRESLQAVMLLLFFSVLAYASYFLYTSRQLIVHRPWGILIGWFAFLMFIAFFARTRAVIQKRFKKNKTKKGDKQ